MNSELTLQQQAYIAVESNIDLIFAQLERAYGLKPGDLDSVEAYELEQVKIRLIRIAKFYIMQQQLGAK